MPHRPPRSRVRTIHHAPIEEKLDPRHHPALRTMLLEPGMRLVAISRWLESVGCPVSMPALCRHRQHVRRERRREEEAVADEAAEVIAYASLAREQPDVDFLTPALFVCELLSLMSLVLLGDQEDARPQTLVDYAKATLAVARVRERFEERKQPGPRPPATGPA